MNDDQNQQNQQASNQAPANEAPPAGGANDANAQQQVVTLGAEQYSMLLDRLSELEELAARIPQKQGREGITTLDQLVEEGRGGRHQQARQQPQNVDLDDMNNTQLADYILNEIQEMGNNLMVEIQTNKVLREIDKCEAKHDDFWQYQEEIFKISTKNPTLSIEQAYKLAKDEAGPKGDPKDKTGGPTPPITQKILNLPPKPQFGGERPGVAPNATRQGSDQPVSIKSAAERAWDEAIGKDKNSL